VLSFNYSYDKFLVAYRLLQHVTALGFLWATTFSYRSTAHIHNRYYEYIQNGVNVVPTPRNLQCHIVNCFYEMGSVVSIPNLVVFKQSFLWIYKWLLFHIASDQIYITIARLNLRICEWRDLFSCAYRTGIVFPLNDIIILLSMTGACPNMEPSCVLIAIYITAVLHNSVLTGDTFS
jgi:hypothetical protein